MMRMAADMGFVVLQCQIILAQRQVRGTQFCPGIEVVRVPAAAQRALDEAFCRQVGVMAERVRLQDALHVFWAHLVRHHLIRVECHIAQEFEWSGTVHPHGMMHIPLAVYLSRVDAFAHWRPNWHLMINGRKNLHLTRHRCRRRVPCRTWWIGGIIVATVELVFTGTLFFTSSLSAQALSTAPGRPRLPARKVFKERTRCRNLLWRHGSPQVF
jgi:hypothetical protein